MLSVAMITQALNFNLVQSNASAPRLSDWFLECHGFWHNAVLIVASFLFVLYLATQSKKSFLKFSHGVGVHSWERVGLDIIVCLEWPIYRFWFTSKKQGSLRINSESGL
ncbi:hypothetical protein QN277_014928 [Acacia crassicarpa]|uniref:Uncharacterized protein n=1 Tax=Acacia crassicarpa TaxID=499986 RepID=A0AAE1JT49_9FABA|nr:hypothetical protein QN277_014928 [Acacia crassicarpa]